MGDERVRFYMDEHIPGAVTRGLLLRGADVLTTQDAGLVGAPDEVQLKFASDAGRVLVTQDDDFLSLHAAGMIHAGIVYAPQGTQVGQLFRGLLLVYGVMEPEEMIHHIEYL